MHKKHLKARLNRMDWYKKIKNNLHDSSLRGFKAEFNVCHLGEEWDGHFFNKKEAEQEMRRMMVGWVCLWKYQGALYQGGDLIEDVSESFEFEVVDNKINITKNNNAQKTLKSEVK